MVESPSRADQLDRAPRKLTSPHYVPQLSSATSPSSAAAAAAYNPVRELDQCRAPQPPSRSFREQYYMQESSTFRPVSGAAGRLFGGGAAAEDHQEVRCPRCDSANTKFCYYNNYNLAQPRHFCRGCRRYWTKGGLLRNVPVGGGCRKPKRGQVAAASSDVVDRNAKNARSGCTGPGSCTSPAAPTTSNTVGASSATARSSSGGCATATGAGLSTIFATDAPPLPPPRPRPRPMFADQAAAFASFFVSPPPLPLISFSAQPKADDAVGLAPTLTLAEQPSSSASCTPDMTPLSARSGGTAMITSAAADWPPETATVIDAGMFDLAGDTSPYWNAASWTSTDPDGTMYLP